MKRMWFAAIVLVLGVLGVAGCPAPEGGGGGGTAGSTGSTDAGSFKIGIMTGTVSQGEDEYRAAESLTKRLGSMIKHVTYPDSFTTEQETMISQLKGLADDPDVKAIIVAQAVLGTMPGIKRVRDTRPDMVFILVSPQEDPKQIAQYGTLCLNPDELRRGETIVKLAHQMGAKKFVHYSFPRHMGIELLARRFKLMSDTCKALGLEFISASAPDPTGDQGVSGAQKFILEDVPRQVAQHGKDTAFFSTNCAMQEPLIRAVLDNGAIFPEQCCPSPTHGYPGAVGLEVGPDMAGDFAKIREGIAARIKEKGGHGRFGTWPVSMHIALIEAGVDLARGHVLEGKDITDQEWIKKVIAEKAGGMRVDLAPYEGTKNYLLVLAESHIF